MLDDPKENQGVNGKTTEEIEHDRVQRLRAGLAQYQSVVDRFTGDDEKMVVHAKAEISDVVGRKIDLKIQKNSQIGQVRHEI